MAALKYNRKYVLYSLIPLIVIWGVRTLMYSRIRKEPPSASADVPPASSSISSAPRVTAPWMTTEELVALHLDAYYQVIIDANIFQPLQERTNVKVNPYQLIGRLSQENETIALIMNTFTRQVHRVGSGDWIDNVYVMSVTEKSAFLRDTKHVITELQLGSMFLKKNKGDSYEK